MSAKQAPLFNRIVRNFLFAFALVGAGLHLAQAGGNPDEMPPQHIKKPVRKNSGAPVTTEVEIYRHSESRVVEMGQIYRVYVPIQQNYWATCPQWAYDSCGRPFIAGYYSCLQTQTIMGYYDVQDRSEIYRGDDQYIETP